MYAYALAGALASVTLVNAIHLSENRLNEVYKVMGEISDLSWENGTQAQAVLEATYPTLSVFTTSGSLFPLSDPLNPRPDEVVTIAQHTLENRVPQPANSTQDGWGLLPDGSAADPASLGIAVMMAGMTDAPDVNGVGYTDAAREQLDYLLYEVPRTSSGAISHRESIASLWVDSVYMVPPFIAFYGAQTGNQTLLQIAYDQIRLYRETLRQDSGLWAHILLGNEITDPARWATGNAWAAAGMARVLATIMRSSFSDAMSSQRADLQAWIEEVINSSKGYLTSNNLLRNHIDDSSSFEDTAGTALMSSAAFRLSTMGLTNAHIPFAINTLSSVSSYVNSTGYLTQVVNPLDFQSQGDSSPEGQAFVVLAYAGYEDWKAQGSQGGDGKDLGGPESSAYKSAGFSWVAALLAVAAWAGTLA